eukprot:6173067-Pleurochrysis_carterae.AAC.1
MEGVKKEDENQESKNQDDGMLVGRRRNKGRKTGGSRSLGKKKGLGAKRERVQWRDARHKGDNEIVEQVMAQKGTQ